MMKDFIEETGMLDNKGVLDHSKQFSIIRWRYVISGILIMMCLGTVYSYSVFRNQIESTFSIGVTQSGLPYMTALAFYAIFMLISGKHIDKYTPRNVIFFGGIIVALGWILSAYASNIYMLTISYGIISGSGVGIVYGVPMAVVAKWFPEKKGLAVGMVLVGFGLSPLITAPLAKYIVEQYGLMNSFMFLGISFGLLISILSFTFKYPEVKEFSVDSSNELINNGHGVNTHTMIRSKNFWGLYLNFVIGTMIGLMLVGMTSSIATELFQIPSKKVPLFMSMFAIFNGAGRPIFGWFTDRLSSKKAMLTSYLLILTAALILVFFKERNVIVYIVSFSIFWFNLGGWLAIAPASTLSLFGTKHNSQNYGVVFSGYGIGAILGVITSGIIIDTQNNYNYLFVYVIALCLVGILITNILMSKIQQK